MFDFGAFYPIDLQYPTDSWEKFTCLPIDYCSTYEQKLSQFFKQVSSPLQDFRTKREKKYCQLGKQKQSTYKRM